jgi:glycosyltransferase involved in cell wall biosynthesis
MSKINVLIPTYNRTVALACTLTSLCFQEERSFNVIISDQSPTEQNFEDASVQTAINLLRKKGHQIKLLRNLPPKGLAQQRQFLLDLSDSPYSLFLDDDLILESYVLKVLKDVLEKEHCGFAGSAVIGLSFKNDYRPLQHRIELWPGKVEPELIQPKSYEWERYILHNAANVLHVQELLNIDPDKPLKYKVAWVGGCVMYDTE